MRRLLAGALSACVAFVALLAAEALIARRGADEPFTNPSPDPMELGDSGPRLTYVVLGDSTGAGRGAPYPEGIAMGTARHLARRRRVRLINRAQSGAKLADVVRDQLEPAAGARPDVVLLSAGANDVTGLTSGGSVKASVERIAVRLRAVNPEVRIVLTGAPDMGTTPRVAQPLRWVAGRRTRQLNRAFAEVAAARRLTLAPIAERTGPRFAADPSLFAADRFHPDARGYATWIPVLDAALDAALSSRP